MFVNPPPDVRPVVSILYLPDNDTRTAFARETYDRLEADPYIHDAELIEAIPDGTIYDTSRKAHEWSLTTDGTHHVCLDDDVKLCEDFGEAATNALQAVPNRVVSFFTTHTSADAALERNQRWFRTEKLWGQAMVMPLQYMEDFLDWCDEFYGHSSEDVAVNCWNCLEGPGDVWITVPSLVEHCEDEVGGSSVGHNPPCERTAHLFIDDTTLDPRNVDYSFELSEIPSSSTSMREHCLKSVIAWTDS